MFRVFALCIFVTWCEVVASNSTRSPVPSPSLAYRWSMAKFFSCWQYYGNFPEEPEEIRRSRFLGEQRQPTTDRSRGRMWSSSRHHDRTMTDLLRGDPAALENLLFRNAGDISSMGIVGQLLFG